MRPKRYILPDTPWLMLLPVVIKDAPAGSVIEVHTLEMQEQCLEAVAQSGREDLTVELRPVRQAA